MSKPTFVTELEQALKSALIGPVSTEAYKNSKLAKEELDSAVSPEDPVYTFTFSKSAAENFLDAVFHKFQHNAETRAALAPFVIKDASEAKMYLMRHPDPDKAQWLVFLTLHVDNGEATEDISVLGENVTREMLKEILGVANLVPYGLLPDDD